METAPLLIPKPCPTAKASLRPNILMVVDYSGSMTTLWDHDQNESTDEVSRWSSVNSVVKSIVQSLDDKASLGMLLFPKPGEACLVASSPQVSPSAKAGKTILKVLPAADSMPTGSTPMDAGMRAAIARMRDLSSSAPRAIVLISDGEPTCEGDATTVAAQAASAWTKDGIPTYVVGVNIESGVSDGFGMVARAGGKPASGPSGFYNSFNEIELQAALTSIADSLPSCDVRLNEEPEFPEKLEVTLNGKVVPRVDKCGSTPGWRYTNEFDELTFCGALCDQVKDDGGEFEATYFCPEKEP